MSAPRIPPRRSFVYIAPLCLFACSPPPGPDGGADGGWNDYAVNIGLPTGDAGYTPIQTGDPLPIRIGFQGFTFARVVFAATGDVPAISGGRTTLVIDGIEPIRQNLTNVDFTRRADGVFYSSPVMVFANDIVGAAVHGRAYRLDVTFTEGSRRGIGAISGTIFFDSQCIDDGYGGCLPPDGGVDGSVEAGTDAAMDAPSESGMDASTGADASCSGDATGAEGAGCDR